MNNALSLFACVVAFQKAGSIYGKSHLGRTILESIPDVSHVTEQAVAFVQTPMYGRCRPQE